MLENTRVVDCSRKPPPKSESKSKADSAASSQMSKKEDDGPGFDEIMYGLWNNMLRMQMIRTRKRRYRAISSSSNDDQLEDILIRLKTAVDRQKSNTLS
jgi:hypothetical protein